MSPRGFRRPPRTWTASRPQNLRGPAPGAGSRWRDQGTIKLTGGTITFEAGGKTETAGADVVTQYEDESEVRAVADGRVTAHRTQVLRDEQEMTVRTDGRTEKNTTTNPLVTETVESEWVNGAWTHRLVGKAPTDQQRAELELFPPPQSALDWFPAGLVKPGHRWEVDAHKLTRLFGPAVKFDSGRWQMTFDGTVHENGSPIARVVEEIDVSGRAKRLGRVATDHTQGNRGHHIRAQPARGFQYETDGHGPALGSGDRGRPGSGGGD